MEPSFSIFARAFRVETPFLNEWLEHHIGIGFSTVYLAIAGQGERTAEDHALVLEKIAPEFIPRIQLFEVPERFAIDHVTRELEMRKRWDENERVLLIDIDEFLILQRHRTVREFWETMPDDDGLYFRWVNYPSLEWEYRGLARQMRDEPPLIDVTGKGKSLARAGAVAEVGVHRHSYVPGASCRDVDPGDAFICHLCSRGLADVVSRILYRSVKTSVEDSDLMKQLLRGPTPPEALPRRLLLVHAQIYMAREGDHGATLAAPLPELRYGFDEKAMSAMIGRGLGARSDAEEEEFSRRAKAAAKSYRVEFEQSPQEIHAVGGFQELSRRLRVIGRSSTREGDREQPCYRVAATGDAKGRRRQGSRWRRWLRLRRR